MATSAVSELPSVAQLFQEAQADTGCHRKNALAVRKHFKLRPADDVNADLVQCINKILIVKKRERAVDLSLDFLLACLPLVDASATATPAAAAVSTDDEAGENVQPQETEAVTTKAGGKGAAKGAASKAAAGKAATKQSATKAAAAAKAAVAAATVASSLSETLLAYLAQGMQSRDKGVRTRSTQLSVRILAKMVKPSPELMQQMFERFMEHVTDKEPGVRVQCILALKTFQGADAPNGADATAQLCTMVQTDPSPEVRRAALASVALPPRTAATEGAGRTTLDAFLSRARDVDATVRRAIYKHLADMEAGFEYIPCEWREKLLLDGLRDRDAAVVKACTKLVIERWGRQCGSDIVQVLSKVIDSVTNPTAAEEVLKAWFANTKTAAYPWAQASAWDTLTPELAIAARVYAEYCVANKMEDQLDQCMPEITKLCVHLQTAYNQLQSLLTQTDQEEAADLQEFVVLQLLMLAKTLDYSDEVGRRRMLALCRKSEMLLHPEPLEGLLPAMVDVMRKLAVNEHDFVRVLVELIADRRDPVENVQRQERRQQRIELEQQVNTLQQERMRLFQARRRAMLEDDAEELATLRTSLAAVEAELAAATDLLSTRGGAPDAAEVSMMDTTLLPVEDDVRSHLHCLAISRLLLERIHEPLRNNPALVTLYRDVVMPGETYPDAEVEEQAVKCLGLCCLLDKDLAERKMAQLLQYVLERDGDVGVTALEIVVDLMMTHGLGPFMAIHVESDEPGVNNEAPVIRLLRSFLHDARPDVRTAAVEGLCKLAFQRIVGASVVRDLVHLSFCLPADDDNNRARQLLGAFTSCFAAVSTANRAVLVQICMPVVLDLDAAAADGSKARPFQTTTVALATVIGKFAEWTDEPAAAVVKGVRNQRCLHAELAWSICLSMKQASKRLAKDLAQLLTRLHIHPATDTRLVKRLVRAAEALPKFVEMRQTAIYLRKFSTGLRTLDKDDKPLTEDELRELVAVYGELPAPLLVAPVDEVVGEAEADDDESA